MPNVIVGGDGGGGAVAVAHTFFNALTIYAKSNDVQQTEWTKNELITKWKTFRMQRTHKNVVFH